MDVFFSLNGPSWFLSALLFCYFMTPFLCTFARKVRVSCPLFVATALTPWLIGYAEGAVPGITGLNEHVSPIIRCLEFFMGMLLVPLFMYAREHLHDGISTKVAFSVLEIFSILAVIYLSVAKNEVWGRSVFALMFCAFVFVFAFDAGVLSKLFAIKPFQMFSSIQFEFYMLHQAVLLSLTPLYEEMVSSRKIVAVMTLASMFALSILYKWAFDTVSKKVKKQ